MYNPELEGLIDAALADGELTEKEKQILFKKAQTLGVDLDEFEMVLDARLVKQKKAEQEKSTTSAPKSNKLGDVKKCPACGAMVQSFQGACPECGYAFENTDANSAVKELSSLLQKEADTVKMEKIIDSYPIPMDKASLLAFVTWLRPQSTDTGNPLANAYYKKYAECVNKIKVSFANDKELCPFIAHLTDDEKKIKKQKIVNITLKNKWFWVGVAILIILFFILKPAPINKNPEKTRAAIVNAISCGDLERAQTLLMDYKGDKKGSVHELALSIVEKYLEKNDEASALNLAHFIGVPCNGSCYTYILDVQNKISEYYIANRRYDDALSMQGEWLEPRILEQIIKNLCKDGKKSEAKRFVNQYYDKIIVYTYSDSDKKRNEWKKKQINYINEF